MHAPLAQTVTGSVTTGLSLSSFTGDGVNLVDQRTTPFITASLARHRWDGVLGFEASAGYVRKGSSWLDVFVRNTLRLSYAEVQALVRAAVPIEGSDLRPLVFAGPSVSWLLSCSMHGSAGGSTLTLPCDDSSWLGTLDIRGMDVGFSFGATVELRAFGSILIAPRIAHTRGLQRLGMGPQDEELDVKNRNTQIGISARVPLR